MVELRPNAFYSRQDLLDMLGPLGVDADGLIARLKPAKRFRLVWWGNDLIKAIEAAPLLKKFKNAKCVKFSPLGWIYALF